MTLKCLPLWPYHTHFWCYLGFYQSKVGEQLSIWRHYSFQWSWICTECVCKWQTFKTSTIIIKIGTFTFQCPSLLMDLKEKVASCTVFCLLVYLLFRTEDTLIKRYKLKAMTLNILCVQQNMLHMCKFMHSSWKGFPLLLWLGRVPEGVSKKAVNTGYVTGCSHVLLHFK